MNIETLKLYKSIRESMEDITVEGNSVSGFVDFNQSMLHQLKRLNNEGLCSATFEAYKDSTFKNRLTVSDSINERHFNTYNRAKIEINKQSNQSEDYFICSSWDALTQYTSYLLKPVKAVYFSDENKIYSADTADKKFTSYLNLSKVCNLVKNVSHTHKGNTYTILCGQVLDIPITLDKSVLDNEIDITTLDELLGKDQHKEAMNSLVREALYNLLSDLEPKSRLSHLVNNFNAFTSKLLVSYGQYVRNYSFDKIRKEYREKATEYVGKINKVFDDVATKTFSIPLGVWFATSKMEITNSVESLQFLKNISYTLMVAFLVVFILSSLLGQFSTLKATFDEYTDLFTRLKSELDDPSQITEIDNLKSKLDTQKKRVCGKLIITIIFAIILLLFTIFVAFKTLSLPI